MDGMNILVLGGSGFGKTGFMLGMYDDMKIGYGGFTFSATDLDVDQGLVREFEKLADTTGQKRWFELTTDTTEYEFSLNYALRQFMIFTWIDYRGGMINESGEPAREFRQRVLQADMVIVCVPGGALFKAAKGDRIAARKLLAGDIQKLLASEAESKPPVVILVTKFDEFAYAVRQETPSGQPIDDVVVLNRIDASIRKQYASLFVEDPGQQQWRVLICPVTLGAGLAADLDNAEISPLNMHIPVLFAYHEYARGLASAWRQRIGVKQAEVTQLAQGWFTRNRTRSAMADLETLKQHHDLVQARLGLVVENFPEDLLFYEGGERSDLTEATT